MVLYKINIFVVYGGINIFVLQSLHIIISTHKTMSKRLFIAVKIKPSEEFLDVFQELKETLYDEKIKWVEEHNMHITLKFLGKTAVEDIPSIIDTLKPIAGRHKSFFIAARSIGTFGGKKNPRVIWVGLEETGVLEKISLEIDLALNELGFERETRKFSPHLTLGRVKFIKDTNGLFSMVEKLKGEAFQKYKVEKFTLFESKLSPKGPTYYPLHEFELK